MRRRCCLLFGMLVAAMLLLSGCIGDVPPSSMTTPDPLPARQVRCPASIAASTGVTPTTSTQQFTADVLLHDDFAEPDNSRLQVATSSNVRYALDNGAYLVAVQSAPLLVWSRTNQRYHNSVVQVDAVLAAGASATASGLIFRYQDDHNFYLFHVAYNGYYRLERLYENQTTVLIDWTPSPAIDPAHNTLRVALQDERMTLFVNGRKLDETLDTTFRQGDVALAVQTFEQGSAAVCFDNLQIVQQ